MTAHEVIQKVKAAKSAQAVFVLRHKLAVVGVNTVRYRELAKSAKSNLVGVYDHGVRPEWLEEDLDTWLEGLEGV